MYSTQKSLRNNKMVTFTDYCEETTKEKRGKRKLSCAMAMALGFAVTLEIMVAGAMLFNFDFHGADSLALIFAFVVLYFGVVAVLTDK